MSLLSSTNAVIATQPIQQDATKYYTFSFH